MVRAARNRFGTGRSSRVTILDQFAGRTARLWLGHQPPLGTRRFCSFFSPSAIETRTEALSSCWRNRRIEPRARLRVVDRYEPVSPGGKVAERIAAIGRRACRLNATRLWSPETLVRGIDDQAVVRNRLRASLTMVPVSSDRRSTNVMAAPVMFWPGFTSIGKSSESCPSIVDDPRIPSLARAAAGQSVAARNDARDREAAISVDAAGDGARELVWRAWGHHRLRA